MSEERHGAAGRPARPWERREGPERAGERTELALAADASPGESYYGALVQSLPDAIVGMALDGAIVSWNPAAEELYGYTPAEAIGRPASLLTPRERRDEMAALLTRLERGERIEAYEAVHVRRDGRRVPVSVSLSPIRDAQGQIAGTAAVVRDVSGSERARQDLREEEILRLVAENSPDIIFTQDRDLRYTWIAHRRTRFRMEQVLGKRDPDFFAGEDLERFVAPKKRVLETGEGTTVEGSVFMAGARCRFEVTYRPRRDAEDRVVGLFGYIHDITERKRAEEERERLLAEAQRRAAELDATFSSLVEGVGIYNPQGQATHLNPSMLELLGVPEAYFLRPIEEQAALIRVKTPEGKRVATEALPLVRALAGDRVRGEVYILRLPNGRAAWVSIGAAPIRTPEGRNLGAVLSVTDITRLREL